jgi:hypothetical protein
VGDVWKEFSAQTNPGEDLAAIKKTTTEFLKRNKTPIPAGKAQRMKQGNYRRLKKAYGRMGEAEVETRKALTRGIKEELAQPFPEIGDLNATESRALTENIWSARWAGSVTINCSASVRRWRRLALGP